MIATRRDRRLFNAVGFGIAAALMGYALYEQHVAGLEPCPLCVLQRMAMIALGGVFAVAALHAPAGSGARVYALLGTLVALGGMAVSGWHVRLQNLPPDQVPSCGPGFDWIIQMNGWFNGLAVIFQGSGECAKVDWTFLGLSMPAWVLVWFVLLGALALRANWSRVTP